jgi:hypothetical protein
MPISDVIVLFEYPNGITPDSTQLSTYGWHRWTDSTDNSYCNTTTQTNVLCKKVISDTLGDTLSTMNSSSLLYKVIKRENFVNSFNIYMPLQLTELTTLKQSNTPMKIYTFRLFTMYSYFIEGKDYINVYPIRISG